MPKKIKPPASEQKIPAMPFPFEPTGAPTHEHVMAAAGTILTLAQVLFQGNPRPIITALKAAEHAYVTGVQQASEQVGMTEKDIEDQEVLGIQLAGIILSKAKEAEEQVKSEILQPDKTLVGPDGRPLK